MKWTKEHIAKLRLHTNLKDQKPRSLMVGDVKIEKKSIEKEYIKAILWMLKRDGLITDYVEEWKFHEVRNFRFDWAIPKNMIAIEYEGIFCKKSRHTTITGYTKDCIKYNLATIDGWKVLRYTAKNYKEINNNLKKLIDENKKNKRH